MVHLGYEIDCFPQLAIVPSWLLGIFKELICGSFVSFVRRELAFRPDPRTHLIPISATNVDFKEVLKTACGNAGTHSA